MHIITKRHKFREVKVKVAENRRKIEREQQEV